MKSKNYLTWASLIVAIYTFQALLYVPQTYFLNIRSNPSFTWLMAFVATFIPFCIFALLAPLIIWLGMRFPLERPVWVRSIFIHLGSSLLFSIIHLFLLPFGNYLIIDSSFLETYRPPRELFTALLTWGAGNIVQYWSLIGITQAVRYFRKYREREHNLTQAQLQALKTQLNPHFLFNTLNAISELVYEDAEEAEQTISKLSELLRLSLKTEQAQEIPLCDELKFLRKYIEIQQTLLQERLKVEWQIAPDTLIASVPNMILQPLVENAIRHGIAPRRSGGTISIESSKEQNYLNLKIEDDGLGFDQETTSINGIGVQNTRVRLSHLYGEAHEFTIQNKDATGGTTVRIKIPFQENSHEAEENGVPKL